MGPDGRPSGIVFLLVAGSCGPAFIIQGCVCCVFAALTKEDSIPEHDPEVSTSCFLVQAEL